MLSRSVSGIRARTVVITLPGSPKACEEGWAVIAPVLEHAVKLLRSEPCIYTLTPDYRFVIDRHPEHGNVIFASACSGHGFKHSAAIGETLAEMALTGSSTIDTSSFKLARLLT